MLPTFVTPQLSLLVDVPPAEKGWVHEIKYDGFRMAMRIAAGQVKLLTRSGLNWAEKYPGIEAAAAKLKLKEAYLDGELCAVRPDGTTSFAEMQAASDGESDATLVFFAFDLLFLNGQDYRTEPLVVRKAALKKCLGRAPRNIKYSEHLDTDGVAFHAHACCAGAEGIMCKQRDAPYASGNRGVWVKVKCHQRSEFVIVGYSDPEGSRSHFGSLLLAYYDDKQKLVYAGRVGTGFDRKRLADVHARLIPLSVPKMPLHIPPPRKTRFGSPIVLSRVHWVRPKLVCEVRFLSWTGDGLLRHTVFEGLRSDKSARDVHREVARKNV